MSGQLSNYVVRQDAGGNLKLLLVRDPRASHAAAKISPSKRPKSASPPLSSPSTLPGSSSSSSSSAASSFLSLSSKSPSSEKAKKCTAPKATKPHTLTGSTSLTHHTLTSTNTTAHTLTSTNVTPHTLASTSIIPHTLTAHSKEALALASYVKLLQKKVEEAQVSQNKGGGRGGESKGGRGREGGGGGAKGGGSSKAKKGEKVRERGGRGKGGRGGGREKGGRVKDGRIVKLTSMQQKKSPLKGPKVSPMCSPTKMSPRPPKSPPSAGDLKTLGPGPKPNANPVITMATIRPANQLLLPVSRIKTIMRTNVQSTHSSAHGVSHDSVVVATKATELFIGELARAAMTITTGGRKREIGYGHLADTVRNMERMEFLQDILPTKVLVRDYLAALGQDHTPNHTPFDH